MGFCHRLLHSCCWKIGLCILNCFLASSRAPFAFAVPPGNLYSCTPHENWHRGSTTAINQGFVLHLPNTQTCTVFPPTGGAFQLYFDIHQDRKWRFRTYTKCFIGHEAAEFFVNYCFRKNVVCTHKEAADGQDRNTTPLFRPVNFQDATWFLNKLLKQNIFHHVKNDHEFEDKMLFYRFKACTLNSSRTAWSTLQFLSSK